jgi:hypothetical protein
MLRAWKKRGRVQILVDKKQKRIGEENAFIWTYM